MRSKHRASQALAAWRPPSSSRSAQSEFRTVRFMELPGPVVDQWIKLNEMALRSDKFYFQFILHLNSDNK